MPASPRFVTHFLGGGWCVDETDCLSRSTSFIGSSKGWTPHLSGMSPTLNDQGVMLGDPTVNPDFGTWALAFIMYCDGSSYTSNVDAPVNVNGTNLYFRGRRLLDAIFEDLIKV